ncbi:MAG: hypothetical protein AAGF53_12175 [Pseudomonadota bacterium]
MITPAIKDFRPFLGYTSEDWPVARQFYSDLGFKENWALENICEIDTGIGHRFLLAMHVGYEKRTAGMVQFWVDSVDDWWEHIKPLDLEAKYSGVKVAAPSLTDWNWRLIYIWDPGGWLLHIGQPNE